ncbi:hypothetical protein NC653_003608 [Populus alba x Populus x berolinensis]|uniref:Uncharacterized protein n=1 Tax=Populus alba x Populus x berolinensis TaxID=444605 RepID=A0AAD6WIH4_9ROSI|nr:hypothetical protein NC653_003608 [Populus alba x Populus x berolinensis]
MTGASEPESVFLCSSPSSSSSSSSSFSSSDFAFSPSTLFSSVRSPPTCLSLVELCIMSNKEVFADILSSFPLIFSSSILLSALCSNPCTSAIPVAFPGSDSPTPAPCVASTIGSCSSTCGASFFLSVELGGFLFLISLCQIPDKKKKIKLQDVLTQRELRKTKQREKKQKNVREAKIYDRKMYGKLKLQFQEKRHHLSCDVFFSVHTQAGKLSISTYLHAKEAHTRIFLNLRCFPCAVQVLLVQFSAILVENLLGPSMLPLRCPVPASVSAAITVDDSSGSPGSILCSSCSESSWTFDASLALSRSVTVRSGLLSFPSSALSKGPCSSFFSFSTVSSMFWMVTTSSWLVTSSILSLKVPASVSAAITVDDSSGSPGSILCNSCSESSWTLDASLALPWLVTVRSGLLSLPSPALSKDPCSSFFSFSTVSSMSGTVTTSSWLVTSSILSLKVPASVSAAITVDDSSSSPGSILSNSC